MKKLSFLSVVVSVFLLTFGTTYATTITDDFNSGTQLGWENQRGDWTTNGSGQYFAQAPGNNPVSASLLSYDLSDFIFEVDINNVSDGGLWARADSAATSGVMLILHNYDIYWHVITNPSSGPWTSYSGASWSGSNVHVRLTGSGNILSAYLDGSTTAITTLDLSSIAGDYSHGRVGLYSNSGQTFDNVSLAWRDQQSPIPEPATMLLFGLGLLGVAGVSRRGK